MSDSETPLCTGLRDFFQRWPARAVRPPTVDATALGDLLDKLQQPLLAWRRSGQHFDPWQVAGLKRKELATTGVLAWLLDPLGSHGFGPLMLNALLAMLADRGGQLLPAQYLHYCRVQLETLPDGDRASRVDMELEADNFYLLIEAKIDAPEQPQQLERYVIAAQSRAAGRRWAVIFLTPHGGEPHSARADQRQHIIPLSWRQLATALGNALLPHYSQPLSPAQHAADCFLRHISQLRPLKIRKSPDVTLC